MSLRVVCPHCAAPCTLADEARGGVVRCPRCAKSFRTAAPAPEAMTAQSAPQPAAPSKPVAIPVAPAQPSSQERAKSSGPRRRLWLVAGAAAACLLAFVAWAGVSYLFKPEPRPVVNRDDDNGPPAAGPGEGGEADDPNCPPARLDGGKAVVALPSPARDVCVGGGGRFLIFHLPQHGSLAVFDCSAARVVAYLPIPDGRLLFAAGMDKLLIVLPEEKLIQRWSLRTFEREASAPLPIEGVLLTAAMGSASDGPLVLGGPEQRGPGGLPLRFLDAQTLKEVAMQAGGQPGDGRNSYFYGEVRASADGRVLGVWNRHVSPNGFQCVTLNGNTLTNRYQHTSVGHVIPGPDGRTLFTYAGPCTPELKPVGPALAGFLRPNYTWPALQGHLYLSKTDPRLEGRGGNARPGETKVSVHVIGDLRRLVTFSDPDLQGLSPENSSDRDALLLEKRLFLVPAAKLFVFLDATGDRLYLRHFDLRESLDDSGADYLVVTSRPPATAVKGQAFSYRPAVLGKKGGVTYHLESGPEGMKVDPGGRVSWDVPADFAEPEANVSLLVSDADGQVVLHDFAVALKDRADPEPPRPSGPPLKVADGPKFLSLKLPPAEGKPAPPQGDRQELALPSPAEEVCVGGAGRFLILHLPQKRELAVFDTRQAKVVKYLPVADEKAKFAAGLDTLIVVLPSSNEIQRWSLTTLEREQTVVWSGRAIEAAAMGSASAGPLVLLSGFRPGQGLPGSLSLLDPKTLQAGKHHFADPRGISGQLPLRVSANGAVISAGDGTFVREVRTFRRDGNGIRYWPLRAVQGPYYQVEPTAAGLLQRSDLKSWTLRVYLPGHERPLLNLPYLGDLERPEGNPNNNHLPPFALHVFLVPDAQLLVLLTAARDKLILHRVNLDEALEKADFDYLFVASQPPPRATKGQQYAYQLAVKSKKGGVRGRLDAGPPGMKLTPEGRLVWDVPADYADPTAEIILTIGDASGQEVFHTFQIAVGD